MRLKTGIWVDALIRRAQAGGAFACVVVRGDRDAGSVMVTVRGRDGLTLYTPERNFEGERVWRAEGQEEDALAKRIEQRLDFDPDLMVVEIDDSAGRHFIEEPVEPMAGPTASPASPPKRAEAGSEDAAAAARALFRDR